jgi:hypothetical protein
MTSHYPALYGVGEHRSHTDLADLKSSRTRKTASFIYARMRETRNTELAETGGELSESVMISVRLDTQNILTLNWMCDMK